MEPNQEEKQLLQKRKFLEYLDDTEENQKKESKSKRNKDKKHKKIKGDSQSQNIQEKKAKTINPDNLISENTEFLEQLKLLNKEIAETDCQRFKIQIQNFPAEWKEKEIKEFLVDKDIEEASIINVEFCSSEEPETKQAQNQNEKQQKKLKKTDIILTLFSQDAVDSVMKLQQFILEEEILFITDITQQENEIKDEIKHQEAQEHQSTDNNQKKSEQIIQEKQQEYQQIELNEDKSEQQAKQVEQPEVETNKQNEEILKSAMPQITQQQQDHYYYTPAQLQEAQQPQPLAQHLLQQYQLQKSSIAAALYLQAQQKVINPQANVFIKNLNQHVTSKDLERSFSQYGKVISARVNYDQAGKNLGYGYVQFQTLQEAMNCIQYANNQFYEGQIIQVMQFQDKQTRYETSSRNNLYIKNLPAYMPHEELKYKLNELFSQFGRILSICVKMDPALRRPFAFVCFETAYQAEQAMASVNNTDPFKTGFKLFLNWAEKIDDRKKRLGKMHSGSHTSQSSNFFSYASQYEQQIMNSYQSPLVSHLYANPATQFLNSLYQSPSVSQGTQQQQSQQSAYNIQNPSQYFANF